MPSSRPLWIIVGILLIPPIVVPLLVGLYDKDDPRLWGFPFYYWFQFLLIPCAAAFTVTAYYVAKEAVRRDRAARGLPELDSKGERR
ncbi:DUF3311 domain-containing protein [Nocardioides sp. CER19]|uniref:DUF3311 domain-containing protein n=1 Tax=Nocardioides sp. CER19 TaxID=3038538 RepID=UPI00244B80DF|nr:DUF3311 domain-containing protein [Nocardioides sp. CER19]MDH2412719.1 DUF3311 domain-containing protein [Nocardioides sp. CER19]